MKRDTLQDWEFRRDEWNARERGMENVYNELAESVLTAPIGDLEEEIQAEGGDPDKVAEVVRQIMRDALKECAMIAPCLCGRAPECASGPNLRQVVCRNCGRRGPVAESEWLAINLWNNDQILAGSREAE